MDCHKKHHNKRGGRCWHFIIYWLLVRTPTASLSFLARRVFSEDRCRRFDIMVKKALQQAVEQQGRQAQCVEALETIVIQRMLFIYWNEIGRWIDEFVELGKEEEWVRSRFEDAVNEKNIENCEPLRDSVKAFGTAGSAILRDVSIDA